MTTFLAIKVARKGYYQGNPEEVKRGKCDIVLAIIEYENFMFEYEEEFWGMNNGG